MGRDTFAADLVLLDRRSTKVILRKAFDAEAISQYARLGGPKEAIAEAFAATETSPGRATAVDRLRDLALHPSAEAAARARTIGVDAISRASADGPFA